MSDVDLNKLKVAELKAELTRLGLDTKGTKPVLLRRLKSALNREKGLPDGESTEDGHADTSLDDGKQTDTSQEENHNQSTTQNEEESEPQQKSEVKEEESMEVDKPPEPPKKENGSPAKKEGGEKMEQEKSPQKPKQDKKEIKTESEPQPKSEVKEEESMEVDQPTEVKTKTKSSPKEPLKPHQYSRYSSPPESRMKKAPSPDPFDDSQVGLDTFHCDLNVLMEKSRWRAGLLSQGGFAYMWGGAKANYGVTSGKVAFEAKITKLEVIDKEFKEKHGFRIGYSTIDASTQLGEDEHSYGYSDSAKSCTNSEFKDYGESYSKGDVITALLNMDSDPVEISFAKNGMHQGIAYTIPKEELAGEALYPHILSKNMFMEINFGQEKGKEYNKLPPNYEDYVMIGKLPLDKRVRAPKEPQDSSECEVIMMCGLPGAGKTYWALNHMKENPDKKYVLLGKHSILEKMKINGEPFKNHCTGKWDETVETALVCLVKLLSQAHESKRNYILDQTNAYTPTRRAKLNPFEGYKKKAIVVVPSDEEFKKRTEKLKKDGSYDIQDYAVLEYKAVLELPSGKEDYLDEVIYPELNEEEAKKLVDKYNEEGRSFRKRNQSFYNEYLSQGSGRGYIKQYRGGGGYGRGGGYNDYGHNARHHPYSMNHRGSNYHHEGNYNPHRPRRDMGGPGYWRQGGYNNWYQQRGGYSRGNNRGGYGR